MTRFSCISIENEWSLLKSMKKSTKIELSFTFSEDVLTQHWMSYRFCFNARYKTHFGRGILRIYRKNTFMKFFIHALILHDVPVFAIAPLCCFSRYHFVNGNKFILHSSWKIRPLCRKIREHISTIHDVFECTKCGVCVWNGLLFGLN